MTFHLPAIKLAKRTSEKHVRVAIANLPLHSSVATCKNKSLQFHRINIKLILKCRVRDGPRFEIDGGSGNYLRIPDGARGQGARNQQKYSNTMNQSKI